jgi:hypothetical protein
MSNRLSAVLCCSLFVLSGCSGKKEQPDSARADLKQINVHVKDMCELLDFK